ncbi:MAG: nitrate reductase maturation protein NarM [Leptolyngbyaceae cyanobacterium SL_7_1]|nr:nitrate reductase maturation protein NarM [Leptolyngbyaceae cyanobacterium SL_7_1]
MTHFFEFEADFVESLRCIPMIVRFKLDTCGIKLKLNQWHCFAEGDRQQLVTLPCETPEQIATYRATVQGLVLAHTQSPASELAIDPDPAWMQRDTLPPALQAKLHETGRSVSLHQWAQLSPLQRFVLLKLSRSNHENRNFVPALQEFGIEAIQAVPPSSLHPL